MKAVVQLVSEAKVTVEGETVGAIDQGLVVLLGVDQADTEEEARTLANKIVHLRIFPDQQQRMNLAIGDVQGAMLIISQFTLLANCRKGRRPSYNQAARPEKAQKLYTFFCNEMRGQGILVETGQFQAMMEVHLVNQGPVTIELDTENL